MNESNKPNLERIIRNNESHNPQAEEIKDAIPKHQKIELKERRGGCTQICRVYEMLTNIGPVISGLDLAEMPRAKDSN